MIMTHDIFVCKPGNAGKVAKMFKAFMPHDTHMKKVLTDMTGQFHRVIMVSEYENLSDYEKSMEAMKNPTPEAAEAMKSMDGFQEMYVSGSREIFKIW